MYNEKDVISKWNSEMYDCNETDINDVEFALSVIGVEPKRILEIACGSGRFLVPMANAGHNVTGLDFDEHMLNRISTKISGAQNIRWHKSDVINDKWETGFDIVLLVANFLFNIVSDMDYKHTLYPEKWFSNPNPNIVWQGTDSEGNWGKMVLLNNTYDKKTGIAKYTRRFEMTLTDGSSLVQEIPTEKHFATLEQVREWLNRSGFVIENEWGDYQGNPISENTHRAIIWAKKK